MDVCGQIVDRLKLQSAKLQTSSSKCALQLMGCIFKAKYGCMWADCGPTETLVSQIANKFIKMCTPTYGVHF